MKFEEKQDNEILVRRLERVVRGGRVSHAYIFEGDHRIDKKSFAESFVKGMLCPERRGENCGMCSICDKIDHGNHEDVIYISASGSSIKDADIISMQERLKTKPFGERNVVIIENADAMTARAQNRLLKTLEEPQGHSVLMLLSENIENLLPTIQSRCVKYRLSSHNMGRDDVTLRDADRLVSMMIDRAPFYRLKAVSEPYVKSGSDTEAFLDSIQLVYRNMIFDNKKGIPLLKEDEIIDKIHAVETTRRQLREGVSAAYAVRHLLLKIGG